MKKPGLWLFIIGSLLVSVATHFFFYQQWLDKHWMIGPNDGLSQIATFKKFIYENYKSGNFFYAWDFGLGGGFYSQLAYYFSTSLVFLLSSVVIFILDSFQWIDPSNVEFWAQSNLFISIIRLSVILFITSHAFRYMKIQAFPAFTGAVVYGCSVMYMRHVVYWEFFADAFIWLPLVVLGLEKLIREGKQGWLIFAMSATLISNFYFAYIQLIFLILYVLGRWVIPLTDNELPRIKQFKLLVTSGLVSFCISAVAFIPAVYGFFNNYRPPYDREIPLFDLIDNILFASPYIVLPVVFVLLIFTFPLYRNRLFRFFAVFSFVLLIFHLSPLAASAFNGFSAPQYRFEYLLSFTIGGCVAIGLQRLNKIAVRFICLASFISLCIYLLSIDYFDFNIKIPKRAATEFSAVMITVFVLFIMFIILMVLYVYFQKKVLLVTIQLFVILWSIVSVNTAAKYGITENGGLEKVTHHYLMSDQYNSAEQRNLIEQVKRQEPDSLSRIDWMTSMRYNTPIVQNFNGTSLYSSIANKALLWFYWRDLKVDTGHETVSRYGTLGNRANLHALLQTTYWMRKKSQEANVPYGFKKFAESNKYVIYKSDFSLPFIRTGKNIYSEKQLQTASVLDREHAMLSGVVFEEEATRQKLDLIKEKNAIKQATIKGVGAKYQNNHLSVANDKGGIDIIPGSVQKSTKDFYIGFSIKNVNGDGFPIKVNKYRTTRKPAHSIYKTNINDLIIRVPAKDIISIRLPKGEYELKNLTLYEEDYKELHQAVQAADHSPSFTWEKNKLTIDYNNQTREKWMALPIPFEKGWKLWINGKEQAIEKANYAFIGFKLNSGKNHIEMVYHPPYFFPALALTIIGLFAWAMLYLRSKRRESGHLNNQSVKMRSLLMKVDKSRD
ncbi:YfhO family protein [Virgibacillus pantothenticus]|uniref:YfhO family protein n=1 Tax=Virgibacillus pantothenticus TaxID=1473 RepID=UPI0025B0ED58|nr:YfhO family protein [Virgibacillus pantothenticus]